MVRPALLFAVLASPAAGRLRLQAGGRGAAGALGASPEHVEQAGGAASEQLEGSAASDTVKTGGKVKDNLQKGDVKEAAKSVGSQFLPDQPNADVAKDPVGSSQAYGTGYYHGIMRNWIGILISLAVQLLVVGCVAFGYSKFKSDAESAAQGVSVQGKFAFGLFDCFSDPHLCCLSCCCPFIRWGDTMRMAGIAGFFGSVMTFAALHLLSPVTGGLTGLILLCVLTSRRQAIRERFMMERGGMTWPTDCLTYCCCACCAIVQEARQLETAWGSKAQAVQAIVRNPQWQLREIKK